MISLESLRRGFNHSHDTPSHRSIPDGDIAEILVYDVAVSDTDRHKAEIYLKNTYGL